MKMAAKSQPKKGKSAPKKKTSKSVSKKTAATKKSTPPKKTAKPAAAKKTAPPQKTAKPAAAKKSAPPQKTKPAKVPAGKGIPLDEFVSMTYLTAIANAGGYTYRAKQDFVFVVRGDDPDQSELKLSVEEKVQPGDIIRVAERLF
jgi:outer membrane biosynthesis protein TonB